MLIQNPSGNAIHCGFWTATDQPAGAAVAEAAAAAEQLEAGGAVSVITRTVPFIVKHTARYGL